MASTYSPNLRLELIGTGEQQGTWGVTTNTNLGTLLEEAIGGYVSVTVTDGADTVLTTVDGGADQSRNMVINLTGTLTAARNVICPAIEKLYVVNNNTTGGFSVTFKVAGQTGVTIVAGTTAFLYVNGTDAVAINPAIPNGSITTAKLGGDITTAGKALLDDADAAAQRTTLGLGTLSTQNANNVNITGGSITNVTLPATPGDSITSARALSAPSYISRTGTYLKADYPLIGSLPALAIYGNSWVSTSAPGSPSESSNTFRSIAYGNGVWIAGGNNNGGDTIIRRSTDNGATWTSITLNPSNTNNISSIAYGNGVWFAAYGDGSNCYRSTDNGLTWSSVSVGGQVSFIDTDGAGTWIGVASGVNTGRRSLDNGVTWTATTVQSINNSIFDITFGNGVWLVSLAGAIRRSTDGGATWSVAGLPGGSGSWYITSVVNDGAGVWVATVSSFGNVIIRSTDNGANFSTVAGTSGPSYNNLATDKNGRWIATSDSGMRMSTDNGATWSSFTPSNVFIGSNPAVAFANSRWMIALYLGYISTDNTATWSFTPVQFANYLYSVKYANNAVIVAYFNQYLSRSTDNGSSWTITSQPISGINNISDTSFGNGVWIAAGVASGGAAFARSTNNGLTWTATSPAVTASTQPYCIANNGSGTWISGLQIGRIYRSTDNGLTWSGPTAVSPLSNTVSITTIASDGSNTWIAANGAAAARSTDNGVTWSLVTTGFTSPTTLKVYYSNGVWFLTADVTPYARYSTDGGATWNTPSGLSATALSAIGSNGSGKWFVGSFNGTTQYSIDNGRTFSSVSNQLSNMGTTYGFTFVGTRVIFAASGRSSDGLESSTQFYAYPWFANNTTNTYLYTGQ